MPKTSPSEQMDFKGLEIIADEFTGTMGAGSVTNASVASDAAIAATKIAVAAYATSGITADDLQGVLEALADRIEALENAA